MTKYYLLLLVLLISLSAGQAQKVMTEAPEMQLSRAQVESQLRFIAADELKGRRTGSEGNNIAARFIASHLAAWGYQSPEGADNYFQKINLVANLPPQSGSLQLDKSAFTLGEDLILLDGVEKELKTTAVYANFGWVDAATGHDDYKGLDVKGKVVVTLCGLPHSNDPAEVFNAMAAKRRLASEKGALGLVEIYTLSYPWRFFRNYFSRERLEVSEADAAADGLLYAWVQGAGKKEFEQLKGGKSLPVVFSSGAASHRSMASQNVIGVLEGTDPQLKDEYILLTAHYDHVGTGRDGGGAYGPQDSIFNGARDNGIGVVALMSAAEALALQRPKRSVLVLAVTAEEIGLLGSQYYADHPLIPLEKTIFNLNTDGAGYNLTTGVGIIGWDRTGTNAVVEKGLKPFDLEVIPDPAKEQGLFDRSDNVSFARKGIPCLTFSPGFRSFDQDLMQYYHQVRDEVGTLDWDYVTKFCQAFAHTARLMANAEQRPTWVSGDKYEEAGKNLYGGTR